MMGLKRFSGAHFENIHLQLLNSLIYFQWGKRLCNESTRMQWSLGICASVIGKIMFVNISKSVNEGGLGKLSCAFMHMGGRAMRLMKGCWAMNLCRKVGGYPRLVWWALNYPTRTRRSWSFDRIAVKKRRGFERQCSVDEFCRLRKQRGWDLIQG